MGRNESFLWRAKLQAAVRADNFQKMLKAIGGVDRVNTPDAQGATPLHWAAAGGADACVGKLLDAGAAIDAPTLSYSTPLHWAASKEKWSTVSILVCRGARVSVSVQSCVLTPEQRNRFFEEVSRAKGREPPAPAAPAGESLPSPLSASGTEGSRGVCTPPCVGSAVGSPHTSCPGTPPAGRGRGRGRGAYFGGAAAAAPPIAAVAPAPRRVSELQQLREECSQLQAMLRSLPVSVVLCRVATLHEKLRRIRAESQAMDLSTQLELESVSAACDSVHDSAQCLVAEWEKRCREWSVDDVHVWLSVVSRCSLAHCADLLRQEGVSGEVLTGLAEGDLSELGIARFGDRRTLWKELVRLRGGGSGRSQSVSQPSEEPPDRMRCPLSLELMREPVMTKGGTNFERQEIVSWILRDHSCPITREPLTEADLAPNRALQEEINEWRSAHGTP